MVAKLSPTTALLVVDVQNDFCMGGALEVPDGDSVVPIVNALAQRVADAGGAVFASRDWHPADSTHFDTGGGRWPVHCVQGSAGARFHPDLALPPTTVVLTKGDDRRADGYSAFDGRTPEGLAFADALGKRGVTDLVVAGLATDYCVKASVLSAREAGLVVIVVEDAVRAVNADDGDEAAAMAAMREAGADFVRSKISPTQWPVTVISVVDLGARRPAGKARRARIPGVFARGATPPAGMPRPRGTVEMTVTGH